MEDLNNVVQQRNKYAQSKSHVATSGDLGNSTAHGPPPHETSLERAARLRIQARDKHQPAFTKYDRATGLNEVRHTVDAIRAAAGLSAVYSACFMDWIIAHPLLANF